MALQEENKKLVYHQNRTELHWWAELLVYLKTQQFIYTITYLLYLNKGKTNIAENIKEEIIVYEHHMSGMCFVNYDLCSKIYKCVESN